MNLVVRLLRRTFTEEPWSLLAWPAAAMVLGTLLRAILGKRAAQISVVPRTLGGLVGIITAPFVHANLGHLVANLPPFLVLGFLLLRHGSRSFLETAGMLTLASGALLWLFGRKGAHMGMSGVIFGFFGYLVGLAYFTRDALDVLVAALVLIVYGGMLAGIKPARNGASWEGHLFGLAAGIAKVWIERRY